MHDRANRASFKDRLKAKSNGVCPVVERETTAMHDRSHASDAGDV
jgi:hypothetical protein